METEGKTHEAGPSLAELKADLERAVNLLRVLEDPDERQRRNAARVIAFAIVMVKEMGIPDGMVDAIREHDPDGVGEYFGAAVSEADGWSRKTDNQGQEWWSGPEDVTAAVAWPEVPREGLATDS